jgi:ATPase subunit of ABC transporter with duplicated ATPase domains
MESIDALLQALKNYAGTILIVSHNRYFISSLATRIIEISHEGLLDFKCNYDEYMEKRNVDLLNASKAMRNAGGAAEKVQTTASAASKQSYQDNRKLQREKEQLEKRIATIEEKCHKLERAIQEINTLLCSEGYFQKTSEAEQERILQKKASLEADLQKVMAEWEQGYHSLEASMD